MLMKGARFFFQAMDGWWEVRWDVDVLSLVLEDIITQV